MILTPIAAISTILLLLGGEPLKVAAASSLRDVLSELSDRFEKSGGPHVDWVFGSSGQLVEQARQGAALDAIVVASREFATALEKERLVDANDFVLVAGNRIVLAAPAHAKSPPKSFEDLADARIKRIAIGDPATVPVGDYAMQVLRSLKLEEKLKNKLVYGTNARQVLAYLQSGEVDAGIVFSTDAAIAADAVRVVQAAEQSWHQPVEYLSGPLRSGKNRASAIEFINFVCRDESQDHFARMGFLRRSPRSDESAPVATSQPSSQTARKQDPSTSATPASRQAGAKP